MATYIFGDIQGCFDPLQALIKKIKYNPDHDRLGFVGDLVNRGPASLETLRFIKQLDDPIIVLGNHDLHLIALGLDVAKPIPNTILDDVLKAPDCDELLEWLLNQPLAYHDKILNYVIAHAGIYPKWSISEAIQLAEETMDAIRNNHPKDFLKNMYGNEPSIWSDDLVGADRYRFIINAFTRMRFCNAEGQLDLQTKQTTHQDPSFKPWFDWRENDGVDILFGHWAALEGHCDKSNMYALDTGKVWGGPLTALRVEDKKIFSV